jgi:hypothetical protein
VVSATGISLSLKTGTGTLGGTLTGTIAAGTNQVTITGVTYTKGESGVVLTATRTSGDNLTAGDSAAFTVNPGSATKVAFSTQPGNSTAGATLSGPPTVAIQDAFGNTVTSSTASITVVIGTNPGGGTLSGTTAKNASAGVASFNNLSINKSGTGYTLTASATGLTGATSSTFNISAAAASQLVFTTQPTNATAGNTIGGPPTVTVQDNFGNTVTSSTAAITIAIGTNPGGGTLSGTTAQTASGGVTSFTNLSIDKAASGYALTVSSTGLTGATSSAFNVTVGAAAKLVFSTQPTNSNAGVSLGGPPTVTVQDSFGNIVPSTTSITIDISNNPGAGTLSGTLSKNASGGVASFTDLSINKAASGYTLVASSGGLAGYWKFDEGSPSVTAGDASGHNNNGTITGATWTTDSKSGLALNFNGGAGQYVEIPNSNSLNPTGGLTISAWVKRNATGTQWQRIVDKHTSGHGPYQMYLYNNNYHLGGQLQGAASSSGDIDSGWLVPAGEWAHVALTYDGANIRFYGN